MEKFKISDIQELFTSDVERFHQLTQTHVTELLTQTPPPQDSLDEALRQTHTLKGLAATVQAWGLAGLGTDFEKLLEVAGTWMHTDREKANQVFQFIIDRQQDWFVMNQFTCMDMLPEAWDIYQGMRGMMEQRWSDYLPPVQAGDEANFQYVRMTDLELPEEASTPATPVPLELDMKDAQPSASTAKPAPPAPLRVVPPMLQRRDSVPTSEPAPVAETNRDVRQPEPIAHTETPAKPTPLQVVPPNLIRRKGKSDATNVPAAPAAETSAAAPESAKTPPVSAPARPEPLKVVPPTLRQASPKTAAAIQPIVTDLKPTVPPAAGPAEQSVTTGALPNPEASAASAPKPEAADPNATPILRVAPPALKRRAKASSSAAAPATAPAAPVESTAAAASVESTSTDESTLEALFAAALDEPVAAQPTEPTVAAKSTDAFTPTADAEMLEMLGKEIAGYLTELAENLAALATNLANEAEWEKTRRLFHTIKGTAATFNLDAISAPAKAAEARCIVAIEDATSRSREAFEICVQRAQIVAKALRLPFDEQPLRAALENALAAKPEVVSDTPTVAVEPEMAAFFIRDAHDQIKLIEQAVLRWEKGTKPTEQVQAAQRGFHTLKGAGNSIGFTAVAQSVHEVEAFLEGVATTGATGSRPLFTFLFGAVDQLRQYLADLAKNPATPWRHDWSTALRLLGQPAENASAKTTDVEATAVSLAAQVEAADDDSHTLRVEAGRLYELMNLIGEMVVDRARLEKKIEQLTTLHRSLAERNLALTDSVQAFQQQFEFNLLQGQNPRGTGPNPLLPGATGTSEFSELEFDRYDQFNILARSLVEVSHDIGALNEEVATCLDSFAAENVRFTQTSQSLQSKVTNLSLVPVHTLFPRLQRAFRDALDVEHKDADLKLSGGEALLDKVVVDKIYAPLLHLLRNAVAHGIEDAVSREKLSKPARGQVRFSAIQMSNQIEIQITDDGAGVNADAVRKRAIEKGWLAADAPALTPDQVVHYIFQPGFSTATKVTSVSGRGIGLDVVRKEIENLNGSVELKYESHQGSTWTLRLPLTLSISQAILADVGGTKLAFPLNFIEAGLILDTPSTRDDKGREMFAVGETSLPVLRLASLFHLPGNEASTKGLIISIGDRRSIVVVDEVLARQEIVIKQLDALTAQHPLLNGATLDAEGGVIPILNLPTLVKLGDRAHTNTGRPPTRSTAKRPDQLRVLIVDDSLSVRKVQEKMLTELGCQVATAYDGLNALEKLREQEFDFIFTDLEMPRLNGYELISDLRGNPAWASLPVVVISSRGADKYITKAMNLGASTFLSKPFTQEQLQQVLTHYAKTGAVLELTA